MNIKIQFGSDNTGICPKCNRRVSIMRTQYIKHCQSTCDIEVCTDCKNDFIRVNDIFFRGVV